MNNLSQSARVRRSSHRRHKKTFIAITLVVVVAVMVAAALVQNRGLQIDARRDGLGLKLDPAQQSAPTNVTYNDGSPIVTAPEAKVKVRVTGPTKSAAVQSPANNGISTHGAASPIVTGQGAVVESTVDTRQ